MGECRLSVWSLSREWFLLFTLILRVHLTLRELNKDTTHAATWCLSSEKDHLFCLHLRGFTVNTASRTHVFKPVSVQAMWWVIPCRHGGWGVLWHHNKSPDCMWWTHAAAERLLDAALPHSATCWHWEAPADNCHWSDRITAASIVWIKHLTSLNHVSPILPSTTN